MTDVTIDQLMSALKAPMHIPTATDGFHLLVAAQPAPFVAPRFRIVGTAQPSLSVEIVFIEASAAIGKSTIAKFISAKLNISILDLSKVPVATGSFKTLVQELTGEAPPDALTAFHNGECPVIIDAMDEGRLLSGETGLESFLETTAQLIQSHRMVSTKVKIIIFGRFESIELARAWFDLVAPGVAQITLQIGLFDKDAAWALIEAYAKLTAEATPGSIYFNFQEAARHVISAYFDAIEKALGLPLGALWTDEQGRAFAGYAPVLAALGSLLAVIDNYIVVANRLERFGGHEAWSVIEAVLNEILLREQRKVREPLEKQFKVALPDQVYDPEEQIALLAQFVQGQPLKGTNRVRLPSAEMANYQDMVQRHLPEHPFVRQGEFGNTVLASTVLASTVMEGRTVSQERLSHVSRQPFFWRSLSRLVDDNTLLDGSHVGHILNSFWNDPLSVDQKSSTVYIRPSDQDSALVSIPVSRRGMLSFHATLPIRFYGRIKNCDIEVAGQITMEGAGARGAGRHFVLHGPINVVAGVAEIDSDSVKLEDNVWLEAEQLISPPNLRLIRNGANVGWGGQFAQQFPWNREAVNLPAPYVVPDADRVTQLIRECAARYPSSPTLTLNPDFTPVRDDPQTRWTTRRFEVEFPRLISLMVKHELATSEEFGGAGFAKTRICLSTNWYSILSALENPTTGTLLREFIDEARREIG